MNVQPLCGHLPLFQNEMTNAKGEGGGGGGIGTL